MELSFLLDVMTWDTKEDGELFSDVGTTRFHRVGQLPVGTSKSCILGEEISFAAEKLNQLLHNIKLHCCINCPHCFLL